MQNFQVVAQQQTLSVTGSAFHPKESTKVPQVQFPAIKSQTSLYHYDSAQRSQANQRGPGNRRTKEQLPLRQQPHTSSIEKKPFRIPHCGVPQRPQEQYSKSKRPQAYQRKISISTSNRSGIQQAPEFLGQGTTIVAGHYSVKQPEIDFCSFDEFARRQHQPELPEPGGKTSPPIQARRSENEHRNFRREESKEQREPLVIDGFDRKDNEVVSRAEPEGGEGKNPSEELPESAERHASRIAILQGTRRSANEPVLPRRWEQRRTRQKDPCHQRLLDRNERLQLDVRELQMAIGLARLQVRTPDPEQQLQTAREPLRAPHANHEQAIPAQKPNLLL